MGGVLEATMGEEWRREEKGAADPAALEVEQARRRRDRRRKEAWGGAVQGERGGRGGVNDGRGKNEGRRKERMTCGSYLLVVDIE